MTAPTIDLDLNRLAAEPRAVARLPRRLREARVADLVAESHAILAASIRTHVTGTHDLAGVVGLFSGGNDSTAMCHVLRDDLTHLAHANTGIGIEQTRQFVRDVARDWGIPLLERAPDEVDSYRAYVLEHGFPGPGKHGRMYQRLKERQLRKVRRELVRDGRRQRVVFVAGRRRTESTRRANVPEMEREFSVVWASPMLNWTKLDLNTYALLAGDVPRNEVTAFVHMSGECLCGSFAHEDEISDIALWFPAVADDIRALEAEIADREDIPHYRRHWGWGGDPVALATSREKHSASGRLCSSCDARATGGTEEDDVLEVVSTA